MKPSTVSHFLLVHMLGSVYYLVLVTFNASRTPNFFKTHNPFSHGAAAMIELRAVPKITHFPIPLASNGVIAKHNLLRILSFYFPPSKHIIFFNLPKQCSVYLGSFLDICPKEPESSNGKKSEWALQYGGPLGPLQRCLGFSRVVITTPGCVWGSSWGYFQQYWWTMCQSLNLDPDTELSLQYRSLHFFYF